MSSHYLIRTFFLILGCISLSFTSCKKEVKTIKHSDVIFKKEGELVIFKKTSDSTKIDLDIEISDNTGSSVVVTNLNRPLQGSTPILSNLDVFHNLSEESNLGITYNYIGRKLSSVGIFGLGDIYQSQQHFLNLIWNLEKDKYNLSVRLNNILDTPFRLEQNSSKTSSALELLRLAVLDSENILFHKCTSLFLSIPYLIIT